MARGNDSKAEKGFISVEDFIRTRDSGKSGLFSLVVAKVSHQLHRPASNDAYQLPIAFAQLEMRFSCISVAA